MADEMVVCNLAGKATSPTSVHNSAGGVMPAVSSRSLAGLFPGLFPGHRAAAFHLSAAYSYQRVAPSHPRWDHSSLTPASTRRHYPQIELKWDPPADVIASIKYRVKYSEQGGKNAKMIEAGGDNSCELSGLQSAMYGGNSDMIFTPPPHWEEQQQKPSVRHADRSPCLSHAGLVRAIRWHARLAVARLYEIKVYVSTMLGVVSKKVAEIECRTGEGIPLGAPTGIKGAFSGDSYVHKANSVRQL